MSKIRILRIFTKQLAKVTGGITIPVTFGGNMHPLMISSITTICLVFVAAAVSTTHALAKPGGDFTSGNPAVAADVNSQFNTLYTALNSGANSINIDGWANAGGNLGYTGGSLGIGIASPTRKVHIIDADGATGLLLATTTAASPPIGESIYMNFQNRARFGYDGSRSAVVMSDLSTSGVTTGKSLVFDSAGAERMRIDQVTGNVGIGTTSPGALLELSQSVGTNAGGLRLKNGSVTGYLYGDAGGTIHMNNSSSAALVLNDTGGNVGIGTSSPGYTLDVNGNLHVGSALSISGVTKTAANYPAGTDRGILSFSTNTTAANQTMFAAWTAANYNSNVDYFIGKVNATAGGGGTVNVRIRADGFATFSDGTATCTINTGAPSMSCSSDLRLKQDIRPIDRALSKLALLNGVYYKWRHTGKISIGLVAQDVERVFPEAISHDERGMKMIGHNQLLGPIVAGINQLKTEKDTQILALERRAAAAEDKLAHEARTRSNLEKLVTDERSLRKQQEIRLAQLELRLTQLAQRTDTRVVAKR